MEPNHEPIKTTPPPTPADHLRMGSEDLDDALALRLRAALHDDDSVDSDDRDESGGLEDSDEVEDFVGNADLEEDEFGEDGDEDAGAPGYRKDDLVMMHAALESYRDESLRWAERRSATMPALKPASRWFHAPQWAVAATAVVALAVTGVFYTQHLHAPADITTAATAPTQQALAVDNELLSSVDQALSGSVAPTEQDLGLTEPRARYENARAR